MQVAHPLFQKNILKFCTAVADTFNFLDTESLKRAAGMHMQVTHSDLFSLKSFVACFWIGIFLKLKAGSNPIHDTIFSSFAKSGPIATYFTLNIFAVALKFYLFSAVIWE